MQGGGESGVVAMNLLLGQDEEIEPRSEILVQWDKEMAVYSASK